MKKIIFFVTIFCYVSFFQFYKAQAVKIVAIVNNAVITDLDVEKFASFLCKIDKTFKCGSIEANQVAMFTFIETILKQEHIKTTGVDLMQFNKGYEEYKQQTLKAMKIKQIPEQFNTYLYNEYIWEIMISSQVKPDSISDNDVKNYAKQNNMKLTADNELKIKNILFRQKAIETSRNLLADLKKYYLVDLKE